MIKICSESIWLFWNTCGQVLGLFSLFVIVLVIAIVSLVFNFWGFRRLTQGKKLVFLKLINKKEEIKVEKVKSNNKPLVVLLSLVCLMLFISLVAIAIAQG